MNGKKVIKTILILVLSICVCSVAFAAEQPLLSFRYSAERESYRVIIDLRMDSGVEMLQFCVKYDAEKLEAVSIEQGQVFNSETGTPTFSNPKDGSIYFAWDALEPLQGGELLILQFKAKAGSSGTAVVCIDPDSETIAADGNYNEIEVEYSKVHIVIGESHEMDTPMPTAHITAKPSATHAATTPSPSSHPTSGASTNIPTNVPSATSQLPDVTAEPKGSDSEGLTSPDPQQQSTQVPFVEETSGADASKPASAIINASEDNTTEERSADNEQNGLLLFFLIAGSVLMVLLVLCVFAYRKGRTKNREED